jgi:ribosomal protein S6--L-glutamate ligase
MILSFHPIFEGDKNIYCAGREPGADDLAAVRAADAVILPQGCKASLYTMARENCANVFPNYDARFGYPGKIGQTRLFRELNAPHPKTEIYTSHSSFLTSHSSLLIPHFSLPFVFKFDWGGEGDNVFLIRSSEEFEAILQKAAVFESTGQSGFLIQEYIPSQNRDLRVAVIGQKMISYWRVQKDTEKFCSNLSKGAVIDSDSDPEIRAKAAAAVRWFCEKTGINLAGFDLLFSHDEEKKPLFIEINYFFGRQGLGGSERFYDILTEEIRTWIKNL